MVPDSTGYPLYSDDRFDEVDSALFDLDDGFQRQVLADHRIVHPQRSCLGSRGNDDSHDTPVPMSADGIDRLVTVPEKAMENTRSSPHRSPVAAVGMPVRGNINPGCDVSSGISGSGTWAERNAMNDDAVAHGDPRLRAITSGLSAHIYPCGMCRRYIHEFNNRQDIDISIVRAGEDIRTEETDVDALLPNSQQYLVN